MKNKILKISSLLSALFIFSPALLEAAPKKAELPLPKAFNLLEEGSVEFNALGRPAMLKIVGKAPAPKGELSLDPKGNLSGTFKLAIASLDTGIKLRNEHMRDKYLEVAKFPDVELTLDPLLISELTKAGDFSREGVAFTGKMKLRGEERPVSGEAKVERKAGKLSVNASFSLKTSDYKIDTPKYLGITVGEDVKVAVSLAAQEK